MNPNTSRYEDYLRLYHQHIEGGHYEKARSMLQDAQKNRDLTAAQSANLLALRGVCSQLLGSYDEAHVCFDTALYGGMASVKPSPALARQCLDYGIFFLNQESIWLERAYGEISRALAYCETLYGITHPVYTITNGFHGHVLHQLGDGRGSVIMQDVLGRLLGDKVPVDDTSLTSQVWKDGTNWLYDCRALIPGFDDRAPYIAIVPKGPMMVFRRFTLAPTG